MTSSIITDHNVDKSNCGVKSKLNNTECLYTFIWYRCNLSDNSKEKMIQMNQIYYHLLRFQCSFFNIK